MRSGDGGNEEQTAATPCAPSEELYIRSRAFYMFSKAKPQAAEGGIHGLLLTSVSYDHFQFLLLHVPNSFCQ